MVELCDFNNAAMTCPKCGYRGRGRLVRKNCRSAQPKAPCAHFGDETGEQTECPTCGGKKTMLKIFACAALGKCTPKTKLDGIACCRGCPSYQAKGEG